MILRNAAVRYGRRTLASPISRSALRTLSTAVETTQTTQPEQEWPTPQAAPSQPKVVSMSKKKQKVVQDAILSLSTDSTHEHRGATWTTTHSLPGSNTTLTPAQQYAEFMRIQNHTRKLGSKVDKRYVPTELIKNPPGPEDVTLELLMAAQTHMGHNTSLWNPANSRYIYGVRQGIHIISLETTAAHLRRAARVVEEVSYRGGLILFVGTRKGQMEIVTKAAEMAGACHLFTKWTPGAITNRDVILKSQGMKVVDHLDQELEDFEKFKGIARPLLPDLVVCLNPLENYTMLYECGLKSIPTIGVIDTNVDPSWVTYTIPANDDSLRAMAVVAGVLGRAGEIGQKRRLQDATKGNATWNSSPDLIRHMQKETKAAIAERKAVMGKMQQNVEGFTEEEQKLLRTQYQGPDLEVSEEDMMDMLGEAASGEPKQAAVKAADVPAEKVDDTMQATLALIEEQLAAAKEKASELELGHLEQQLEAAKETVSELELGHLEQQLEAAQSRAADSLAELEAHLKGSSEQQ